MAIRNCILIAWLGIKLEVLARLLVVDAGIVALHSQAEVVTYIDRVELVSHLVVLHLNIGEDEAEQAQDGEAHAPLA